MRLTDQAEPSVWENMEFYLRGMTTGSTVRPRDGKLVATPSLTNNEGRDRLRAQLENNLRKATEFLEAFNLAEEIFDSYEQSDIPL